MNLTNITAIHSPKWVCILSGALMSFILIAGVIINVFVLVLFAKYKQLLTTYNVNIIVMVINNLCMCVFGYGMPIIAEFSGHFLTLMSMDMCIVEAFIVYFFGLSSIYILVAVAITRYMIVAKKCKGITKETSFVIMCIAEVLALMFAVAPLLGFGSYGLEPHGTGCGLDWRHTDDLDVSYITTITIFCFFLPIAVIAFCYQRIYTKVS